MKLLQCKGGSSTVEDNTYPTGPFEPQIPYINKLFSEGNRLYDTGGPQQYDGSTVADTHPQLAQNQQAVHNYVGQNVGTAQAGANAALNNAQGNASNPVLDTAQQNNPFLNYGIAAQLNPNSAQGAILPQVGGNVTNSINAALSANQGGLGGVVVPGTDAGSQNISGVLQNQLNGQPLNPYLEQLVQDQASTAARAFNDNVLPTIRTDAVNAGQFGGTRHGIAEGIASSRMGEDISKITNQLYGDAYDKGLQAQQFATGVVADQQQSGVSNSLQGQQLQGTLDQQRNQTALNAGQLANQFQTGANQALSSGTNTAAGLLTQGGAQGVQQQNAGLGALPGLLGSGSGLLTQGNQAGVQQHEQSQAQLTDVVNQHNYDANLPWQNLAQYQQFVSGPFGSSITGEENGDGAINPYQSLPGFGVYNPTTSRGGDGGKGGQLLSPLMQR